MGRTGPRPKLVGPPIEPVMRRALTSMLLAVGLVLLAPAAAAAAPAETGRYYVVGPPVDGQREYLYAIALRILGNGNRFHEIVTLNEGPVPARRRHLHRRASLAPLPVEAPPVPLTAAEIEQPAMPRAVSRRRRRAVWPGRSVRDGGSAGPSPEFDRPQDLLRQERLHLRYVTLRDDRPTSVSSPPRRRCCRHAAAGRLDRGRPARTRRGCRR